jgi:hypothetical protein
MASKTFARLEERVAREYRKKGYSRNRAAYIGRAVAGEVAQRKHAKRNRQLKRRK